tara:strand:- start:43 stop:414 length:372 start_codon:yes stop_codon:yes gene_type:complete
MSKIVTLTQIKNRKKYIDQESHTVEIKKYQSMALNLVEKINTLKKDKLSDINYIEMLESKLKELSKKIKATNGGETLNIVKPNNDDSIFKKINKLLLQDAGMNNDDYEKMRDANLKKMADLLK